MELTHKQALVLYALGETQKRLNAPFARDPVRARINKAGFIRLVLSINLFSKKARALYKNLESLEAKNTLDYDGKNITLTPIGQKLYLQLAKKIEPYTQIQDVIKHENLLKHTKIQTMFRAEK